MIVLCNERLPGLRDSSPRSLGREKLPGAGVYSLTLQVAAQNLSGQERLG